uniref:Extended synaptotagmin-like protein 1b n=1 Tax=Esox lucius TaxID=8010 RepID=A0AAY5LAJ1_ESOLU
FRRILNITTSQKENNAPNSGEMETNNPQGLNAVSVLWTFGKCLGALLPVYLAGYYRVSTSILVFGLMVYTGWKHSREAKEARLRSAIHHYENEQHISMKIFKSKKDLPAWVNFPDVEKVEWLNKILQQVWPFVGQYLEKLLVETIAPSIRSSSTHLQTLTFTKVDFGDKAMKVVGVKAHTENEKGQVLLDVYISYVGDVEINVEVKKYFCKAGVKGIQLHGMMRVILEPLIGDVPIVGAVTMFFIRRPKLDINWTGLTNLLDIPGLNIMSDTMIMDAIASFLVLPNRLTVPLVADLHVAQLRSPLPRGVVRIHLLEADDLPAKDNYMKGVISGMSDPYAVCRVGPQTFTSQVVDNTVCPKWGEMYEVIVHEVPGQELEVEVYDKDPDKDDFLGRTKVDLALVKKSKVVDEWFTLKETKSGRVHFRLEWLVLQPSTERLEEVLHRNESMTVSSKSSDPPSAAILAVYLDKAEALPMKKGNKEPSPMVQMSVQDVTRESRTSWTTINPVWEDAFTFFIPDPRKQSIDIQVKDNDRTQSLGSLSIPLSRLLSSPNLSLDQWFQLDNSGSASRIYINTVLRGVLRIHLLEGQNLVPKDNMIGGMVKGKSDPYVKINIGGETFESRVINRNLNPTWNEMYEVVLTTLPGQELHLEVFDKDMDMKDDFMGRYESLGTVIWYFQLFQPVISVAVKVCDRTTSPQWDEAFYFLVRDPREELLIVKLSHCWTLPIGSLVVPLRELLSEPDLVLDQWLSLDGASPDSQILLKAELKVRNTQKSTQGVLRIHLLEAQNLIAKDNLMGGLKKGKSDPYVKINIGGVTFKSHVVKENLNPTWNEMFETVMTPQPSQEVQVELYDKDMDSDDFLGSLCLFQWFTLKDVKSGRVHLVLEWVPTESEPEQLDQVLQLQSLQSYQNKAVPAAALLFVYMDRAHSLPFKKSGKEPKAGAELVLGKTTYRTKVCDRTKSPQWDEAFYFLIHDPRKEILIVRLSSAWDQALGSVVIPVRELLSEPGLVLDKWLSLDGATPDSEILLRAELKVTQSHIHIQYLMKVSTPLTFLSVQVSSQPSISETEEVEVVYEVSTEDPSLPETLPTQPTPDGGMNTEVRNSGVLRIHILEAKDLVAMDKVMGGLKKGKSDPYVKINIGGVKFKSLVIKENLNPTWNEMFETVLSPHPGQEVQVQLYDKDLDSDDFLGRLDQIYLCISIMVLQLQSLQSYQNKAVPAAALLFIYMDRAHSLPVCDRTKSPQWDEAFHFLIHDPKEEIQRAAVRTRSDSTEGRALDHMFHVVCRDLPSSSKDGLDTYISLILLPDKSKAAKRKTSIKKKDLNPEYNERFDFDLSLEDASHRHLSVSVKNSSASFRSSDLIGQVLIELAQIDLASGITEW